MLESPIALGPALDAFWNELIEPLKAGRITSENTLVHYLGIALRLNGGVAPGSLDFEHPAPGGGRLDLWVNPNRAVFEAKYYRPTRGGSTRGTTKFFGDLLSDFIRLATCGAEQSVSIMISNAYGWRYLGNQTLRVPLSIKGSTEISQRAILMLLPATARESASKRCTWKDLAIRNVWTKEADGWHAVAWSISGCDS